MAYVKPTDAEIAARAAELNVTAALDGLTGVALAQLIATEGMVAELAALSELLGSGAKVVKRRTAFGAISAFLVAVRMLIRRIVLGE